MNHPNNPYQQQPSPMGPPQGQPGQPSHQASHQASHQGGFGGQFGQPQPGHSPGYGPPQQAAAHNPGYAQPGHNPGYGGGSAYEFRESENEVLAKAANAAKFLGIVFFVQAAFALINFNIIGLAIDIALGVSFFQGGKSLQAVVETQGNDIPHLMEGLEKLSSALLIRLVLIGIALGFMILIMLGAILLVAAA